MAYPTLGVLSSPQLIQPATQANPASQPPQPAYPVYSEADRSYSQYVQNAPLISIPMSPLLFRSPERQSELYQFPAKTGEDLDSNAYGNLKVILANCLGGFNPTSIDTRHPIHSELFNICSGALSNGQTMPLHQRVPYLESFISEVVHAAISSTPGREAEAELLEIALRNHLFWGMLQQEKTALLTFFHANGKLPLDLPQTEAALHGFVSKNNFYSPTCPWMAHYLIDESILNVIGKNVELAAISLPLHEAIAASEGIVSQQLSQLQLTETSQCALSIEAGMRNQLATRMIAALAGQFRSTFDTTGKIDQVEFEANVGTLRNFFKRFEPGFNIEKELIEQTLQLPIDQARAKVEEEKPQQTAVKKGTMAQLSSRFKAGLRFVGVPIPPRSTQSVSIQEKKLETLAWMESRLKALTALYPPLPSAPPIDEVPAPAPVQRTYKIDDKDIPTVSYVSVAFEGKAFKDLPFIVQRDVLNHVFYYPTAIKGNVEVATRDLFNNDGPTIFKKLREMNELKLPETGLPSEFVKMGQEILDLYYSIDFSTKKQDFMNKFQQLPKTPLFYQYVYEMAKAANIEIADWDKQFAEYNWERIIPLSVQALERCLHTTKS